MICTEPAKNTNAHERKFVNIRVNVWQDILTGGFKKSEDLFALV